MTLATAQANVPPELKQRLELITDSIAPHDLYHFTDREAANPVAKFLLYPSGLPTPYHVLYNENELVVRNQTEALYCHRFPVGTEIISVEYLQSKDGQFGLIVIYNDIDKGYLARLAEYGGVLKVVNEVYLPHAGTCLKVIIDDMEMPHSLTNLARPMHKWTNVIVAGTQFGHAYVLFVPIDEKWSPNDKPQEGSLTDALGTLHREKDQNGKSTKFIYRSRYEGRPDIIKHPRDVYVSSIAYIQRSCDLLLGLSFGGIVQVGITPSGDIVTNVYQSSAPVYSMVPMLPHDDPNMNVWFWAFHGERAKGLTMVLYEGSYRVIGQENVPLRDRDFKSAIFTPRMADQPAEKGTQAEWITAHTLTRERRFDGLDDDRRDDESTPHNTTLNDTDIDLSQLFFCYKDANGNLKFGLFDLNTYYYKRLQGQPRPDSTLARQCPFLTNITGPNITDKLGSITDIMVDCGYITKFQFMVDAEQDIYASGVNLMRINFVGSKAQAGLRLCSLPMQVLDTIYDNMEMYRKKPREAIVRLLAVGLMSGSSIEQARHGEYFTLMTAAVLYGYIDSVIKIITSTAYNDWTSLRLVNEWMWSEVQRARSKLDSLSDVLFSVTAKALSADQKRQLRHVTIILKAAKIVYRHVLQKFKEWEQFDTIPREVIAEHEVHLAAVTNLSDFSNCIRNLYHLRFLPLGERNYEERKFLEDGVRRRRKSLGSSNSLFVTNIIDKMQKISPDEAFWLEQSGKEWYPPALHNGISALLVMAYQQKMKQQFIIYYVIDLVIAKKKLFTAPPKPGYEGVLIYIEEILEDVLRIGKSDIVPILKIWYDEQKTMFGNAITEVPARQEPERKDFGKRIEELASRPYVLSADEEKQLKEYCEKVPYGHFRYQLYLLERSRFLEVEMLEIPKGVNNRYVDVYSQALPGLNKLQRQLKFLNVGKKGPQWPEEVVNKIKSFDPSHKLQMAPQYSTAKTPVPIFKRIRKLARIEDIKEVTQEEKIVTSTPESKKTTESTVDITPIMNELDDKAKEKIHSILRTPTSRRARAAAAAEGQSGVQITPEIQPSLPAPTSIMKTPNRRSSHISPSRGIRWDPDFVEPSLDGSALSPPASKEDQPIPQMNLEADESVATEEDALSQSLEEQSDDSNGNGSDDGEEPIEIDEKSFEVQEDMDVEANDEADKETELIETDKTFDVQSGSIRLVEYSICESTFNETPIRWQAGKMLARKWIDKDGNEHSFEEQEPAEEPEDNGNLQSNETKLNETYTIETSPAHSPPKAQEIPQEIIKAASRSPVKSPIEEAKAEEDDEVPPLDIDQYKKKPAVLAKKPPHPRKLRSEEPEPIKPLRARRSISESVPSPEATPQLRRSTRRSISRTNINETPKSAQRALFKDETASKKKSPARAASKDSLTKKTPSPKKRSSRSRSATRTANVKKEEETVAPKSPSRRSRTPSVSRAATEPKEPRTPTTRSRTRQSSVSVSETATEPTTPTRRKRTASLKVAETAKDETSKSPSRRGKAKEPAPSTIEEEEELPLSQLATKKQKTPTPKPTKSRSIKSRSNTPSEVDPEESKSVKKRGRPRKLTVEPKEKGSALAVFRATLAEKRNATTLTRKRGNTESTEDPAPKKSAVVPETIDEEPTTATGRTRRTSRSRTQSQSQAMESAEMERRSAPRPKKSQSTISTGEK